MRKAEVAAARFPAMLIASFHLAKGHVIAGRHEDGIVAETAIASWRSDQGTLDFAAKCLAMPIGPCQAKDRDEPRATLFRSCSMFFLE